MMKLFKQWSFNVRYLARPRWDTGIPAPELVRITNGRAPGKAIDIGCGTGTNVLFLAQRGWSVTGIDFAPLAIQKARTKLQDYPARLLVADVAKLSDLELPGPYDLALDMGCFHGLSHTDREAYVWGLAKWIVPGGTFLLYAFQVSQAQGFSGVSKEAMVAYFRDGFILANYEQGKGRPSAWYYFEKK
jgi:SAM-dependent methyltransferase